MAEDVALGVVEAAGVAEVEGEAGDSNFIFFTRLHTNFSILRRENQIFLL